MADAGSVGAAVAAGHDAGSVGAAVAALRERLAAAGVPTPGVDAELLARAALGWSRGGC